MGNAKRNKPSLIYPCWGLYTKVCFAYILVFGQPKNETGKETGKSDDENPMEILSDQIIRPTSFVIESLNSVSGFKKQKNEILNNFTRTRLIR